MINTQSYTVKLDSCGKSLNFQILCLHVSVGNVNKVIPDIRSLLTDLTDQSDRVETLGRQVTTNIAALREKIDIARNQANRVTSYELYNKKRDLSVPLNMHAQRSSEARSWLFV